jgi:hypothetical protein
MLSLLHKQKGTQEVVDWSQQSGIPLSVSGGGKQSVSELFIHSQEEAKQLSEKFQHKKLSTNSSADVIVECVYKHANSASGGGGGGGWKVVRYRDDKSKPNSLSTAWRVMEASIDPLHLTTLVEFSSQHAFTGPSAATNSTSTASTSAKVVKAAAAWGTNEPSDLKISSTSADDVKSVVAAHYDEVTCLSCYAFLKYPITHTHTFFNSLSFFQINHNLNIHVIHNMRICLLN